MISTSDELPDLRSPGLRLEFRARRLEGPAVQITTLIDEAYLGDDFPEVFDYTVAEMARKIKEALGYKEE